MKREGSNTGWHGLNKDEDGMMKKKAEFRGKRCEEAIRKHANI